MLNRQIQSPKKIPLPQSHTTPVPLSDQLSRNSIPYQDPLAEIDWQNIDHDKFWLPENALTIYGLAEYQNLSLAQKKHLSHYEFLYFVHGALWLESLFIERIARSLKSSRHDFATQIYHLHELREEAGHSLMFLELIKRSELKIPTTTLYRWNLANFVALYAPFESSLFWLAVLIGEQVPDEMNRLIRRSDTQICSIIRQITTHHVLDEARHIAHAQAMLANKIATVPVWQRKCLQLLSKRIFSQFVQAFYYPPPSLYQLAGLPQQINWPHLARTNIHRKNFIRQCISTPIKTLNQNGIYLHF